MATSAPPARAWYACAGLSACTVTSGSSGPQVARNGAITSVMVVGGAATVIRNSDDALQIGGVWLAIGGVYLAVLTKGFRRPAPEMTFDDDTAATEALPA
ncbi:hypothetical protein ACPCYV_46700 [Streptomyces mordarskii]|uniref:hypothetical protein n=1 Tax=Streptomyces mordarskii TaxID=1226758 RepID=UPI003EDB0C42